MARNVPDRADDLTPRGGRCALVGRPNVGKSTLLNALLEQKLVIATPRPGTTRTNVLGVFAQSSPPTQIAFVDTPGLAQPKTALHRVLVDEARRALADVDATVLVTEASDRRKVESIPAADRRVMAAAQEAGAPVVVAINKVDRVDRKTALLPLLQAWAEEQDVHAVVPVSALRGTNLPALVSELRSCLPAGFLYDNDMLTDRPERFFASEFVREAVLRHTRAEVPYGVAVRVDEYSELGHLTRIAATILVEKASHKPIVVGARGALIKRIGTEARKAIESLVGRKVCLDLWVKVLDGWTSHPVHARELAAGPP